MKICKYVAVSMLTLTLFVGTPAVIAQTGTASDESIEQRLQEEGLNEAPNEIKVDDIEYSGQEPSSGFVDENGKALSDEEYAQWREDNEKGFFKKNPLVIPVALVAIAGVVFVALKRRK